MKKTYIAPSVEIALVEELDNILLTISGGTGEGSHKADVKEEFDDEAGVEFKSVWENEW